MERVCLIRTAIEQTIIVVFYPDTLRHWSHHPEMLIINNKQTDHTKLQNHNEQIQVLLSII